MDEVEAQLIERDLNALVGLPLVEVVERARLRGLTVRVLEGDEAGDWISHDLDGSRINVATRDGHVTQIIPTTTPGYRWFW